MPASDFHVRSFQQSCEPRFLFIIESKFTELCLQNVGYCELTYFWLQLSYQAGQDPKVIQKLKLTDSCPVLKIKKVSPFFICKCQKLQKLNIARRNTNFFALPNIFPFFAQKCFFSLFQVCQRKYLVAWGLGSHQKWRMRQLDNFLIKKLSLKVSLPLSLFLSYLWR